MRLYQVQATGSAEAAAREVASLVQSLTAGDKVAAISDATKDLHSAISKLEKVNRLSACAEEAFCRRRLAAPSQTKHSCRDPFVLA